MALPEIKGFLESSFVDWPGKMAAVVFLPGCNFRCPYCHNAKLVTDPGGLATWSFADVLGRLEGLRDWLDGVCVSGGEPTLHAGLPELLDALAAKGWPVKLDTNGSRPGVLERLLAEKRLAAVALDLKAPLEPIPYRRNAGPGSDPEAVRQSLELLAASGVPLEVRTTAHPELLSRSELLRLAAEAGAITGGRARFTAQRCRVESTLDPDLAARPPLSAEEFRGWAEEARRAFEGAGEGSGEAAQGTGG